MGMCIGQGANLHMAQLMPLPLTVSWSWFYFSVAGLPMCPGQNPRGPWNMCLSLCWW